MTKRKVRRSGNQAAARSLGFDRTVPEQRRKRDAASETIRGGRRGRLQSVATRTGKWSKRVEDLFLDILRGCGNVAAAARAIGFSQALIWHRRGKWPEFARRIEAIERHDLPRQLAEGWTRDEATGLMIPPGWARIAPPAGEDGAAA